MTNKKTQYNVQISGYIMIGHDADADDVLFIVKPSSKKLPRPLCEELCNLLKLHHNKEQLTINYHINDNPIDNDSATLILLTKLYGEQIQGNLSVDFNHRYSELTGYLWTDEELNVGGHDLVNELKSYVGKYLLLNISLKTNDKRLIDHINYEMKINREWLSIDKVV